MTIFNSSKFFLLGIISPLPFPFLSGHSGTEIPCVTVLLAEQSIADKGGHKMNHPVPAVRAKKKFSQPFDHGSHFGLSHSADFHHSSSERDLEKDGKSK